MSIKLSLQYVPEKEEIHALVTAASSDLVGKSATLMLCAHYLVKDSRPVNHEATLFSLPFTVAQGETVLPIPSRTCTAFSYKGSKLDIALRVHLKVNDGYVFDTELTDELEVKLGCKPQRSDAADAIVEPKDHFCMSANFSAIPLPNKLMVVALSLVAAVVIAINTFLGVHDQFVPESQTYFYSQRSSDGDSNSPLVASLAGSGVLGALVWAALRRQLRRYMTFSLQPLPGSIGPDTVLTLRNLLQGRSRVPLQNAEIWVVACNFEHGQYRRGSGTKVRTVSFREPVNGVVLYREKLPHIPAGAELSSYLKGSFSLEQMFNTLYPAQRPVSSHGLSVHWEVQLRHDELIDQEIICPTTGLDQDAFYRANAKPKATLADNTPPPPRSRFGRSSAAQKTPRL